MAENRKPRRGPGGPFQPGQSGNPGGRPANTAKYVRALMRKVSPETFASKVNALIESGDAGMLRWFGDKVLPSKLEVTGAEGEALVPQVLRFEAPAESAKAIATLLDRMGALDVPEERPAGEPVQ